MIWNQIPVLSTKLAITLSVCLCITDSLLHTTYVETNNGIQLPVDALLTHCDIFVKFVNLSQKISLFI